MVLHMVVVVVVVDGCRSTTTGRPPRRRWRRRKCWAAFSTGGASWVRHPTWQCRWRQRRRRRLRACGGGRRCWRAAAARGGDAGLHHHRAAAAARRARCHIWRHARQGRWEAPSPAHVGGWCVARGCSHGGGVREWRHAGPRTRAHGSLQEAVAALGGGVAVAALTWCVGGHSAVAGWEPKGTIWSVHRAGLGDRADHVGAAHRGERGGRAGGGGD